jgi:hypothetical protein
MRLTSEADGLSPARGPALGAEHVALSVLEPSRKDVLGGRLSQKKGAHRPSFCLKRCPPAPSPRNRSCLPLWRYTIIRGAMSICLMGGLAMDAGQSCIAGPSVFSISLCYQPSCALPRPSERLWRRVCLRLCSCQVIDNSTLASSGEQVFFRLHGPGAWIFPIRYRVLFLKCQENQGERREHEGSGALKLAINPLYTARPLPCVSWRACAHEGAENTPYQGYPS